MKKWNCVLVLLALVTTVLAGCKTPCSDPGSVAVLVTGAVVNKWQCAAPDQVQTDVAAVCSKLGLCTVPAGKGGLIANTACPLIVNELRGLASGKVPASWECNSAAVGQDFATALTMVCEQLPF